MIQQILNKFKSEFEKAVGHFKSELNNIQTGRATPSLVEEIDVEAYDGKMKLKELAAISTPESRQILIQPWDKSIISKIEKAIINSTSFSPVVDESILRINIPALNEEMRKGLVKKVKEKMEEARISVRRHREEAWKDIQDSEKKKEINEDDKFRGKDKLQEMVDGYNEKIEEMAEKKEKEIMGNN